MVRVRVRVSCPACTHTPSGRCPARCCSAMGLRCLGGRTRLLRPPEVALSQEAISGEEILLQRDRAPGCPELASANQSLEPRGGRLYRPCFPHGATPHAVDHEPRVHTPLCRKAGPIRPASAAQEADWPRMAAPRCRPRASSGAGRPGLLGASLAEAWWERPDQESACAGERLCRTHTLLSTWRGAPAHRGRARRRRHTRPRCVWACAQARGRLVRGVRG